MGRDRALPGSTLLSPHLGATASRPQNPVSADGTVHGPGQPGAPASLPAPAAIPQHQQARVASASKKEGTAMGIQASRSGLRTTGSPSPLERSLRASPKHPALRSLQTQLLCSI